MKDKEKQTEEMAKTMCGLENPCIMCYVQSPCLARVNAKALIEQGYRKLPEDSVVITKEEYEKLLDKNKSYTQSFMFGFGKGRKETAEKFINLSDSDILVVDTQEYGEIEVVSVEKLQEIAKTFRVEIKE